MLKYFRVADVTRFVRICCNTIIEQIIPRPVEIANVYIYIHIHAKILAFSLLVNTVAGLLCDIRYIIHDRAGVKFHR